MTLRLLAFNGSPSPLPDIPPAGSGTIAVAVDTPTRITAPALVGLEATAGAGFTLAPDGAIFKGAFHTPHYAWDTDDSGAWASPINLYPAWNTKTRAFGPNVAHVYDTPGTYNPVVGAADKSGNTGRQTASPITVLDPDDVYTGTTTVCIALDGNFTGTPSGCQTTNTLAGLQTIINAYSTSTPFRILFKRGEVYDDTHLLIRSNRKCEYIGAWGTGAKPVLKCIRYAGDPERYLFSFNDNLNFDQITVTGLKMQDTHDPRGEVGSGGQPFKVVNSGSATCRFLCYDCEFSGFDIIDSQIGPRGANGYSEDPVRSAYVDCIITDWRSFGFLQVNANSNKDSWMIRIGCRIAHNPDALLGTDKNANPGGNDHGPDRTAGVGHHYYSCNDVFTACGWSSLSPDQAIQPCFRVNTNTNDIVDNVEARDFSGIWDRNYMEGGYQSMAMSGQNAGSRHYPGNYLIDKNLFAFNTRSANAGSNGIGVNLSFGGTTIRNNFAYMPNVPHYHDTGNASDAFVGLNGENNQADNADQRIAVYNNTILNDRNNANDPGFQWVAIDPGDNNFNNVVENNNVVVGATLDTPVGTADLPLGTNDLPGFTARYKGSILREPDYTGSLGTVADNASFTLSYRAGTNQAYYQGLTGGKAFITDGTYYYEEIGEFEVAFEASQIRITNRSGVTWSGSYVLRLDESGGYDVTAGGSTASPANVPLPIPQTGSAALGDATSGLVAYDVFTGAVRKPTPDRGAFE